MKITIIFSLLILCTPAQAKILEILQSGRTFLESTYEKQAKALNDNPEETRKHALKEITLHLGDSLVFKNLDTIAHNVVGVNFDLNVQKPGAISTPQIFDKAGVYEISCAIHPKMKLKVIVQAAP